MPKNDCAICTNKLKKFVTTTRCKHKYHEKCIRKWSGTQYLSGKSVSCPMCRQNLKPEWKKEFTSRGRDALKELDAFHHETISMFYYLMQNNCKMCKDFRSQVQWNRVDRIGALLRTKNMKTNINSSVYFNIFTQILNYTFFISEKRDDPSQVTRYVNQFYVLTKSLLLFYKNIYESFPNESKEVRLSIKHAGIDNDIMNNKFLLNLRYMIGLMFVRYDYEYPEIMSKSGVYHLIRKPSKFKELMRIYKACCTRLLKHNVRSKD